MKDGTKLILALLGLAAAGGAVALAVQTTKPAAAGGAPGGGEMPPPKPGPVNPGHGPGPKPLPRPDIELKAPPGSSQFLGVLSQQAAGGSWCGGSVVPGATTGYSGELREIIGDSGGLVWGYQRPGGVPPKQNAAQRYGKRLLLTLVSRYVSPTDGWEGGPTEAGHAKYLAGFVGGVSWKGFIHEAMRPVLAAFGAQHVPGHPIVLVKEKPRDWLNAILDSWRSVGFYQLIPILDASSGADNLAEMIDECRLLGLDFMLSSLQVIEQLKVDCSLVEVKQ
jgi:hypothetical protein